jgi:hypothetical protein
MPRPISNCPNRSECPCDWTQLQATEDADVRFCRICNQPVPLCDNPYDFARLVREGRRAAIPVAGREDALVKEYEIALVTGSPENSGTNGEVWIKLEGAAGITGWIQFSRLSDRYFEPGSVAQGHLTFADIGVPEACYVALTGEGKPDSWFLETVELVDNESSHVWEFGEWISTEQESPICRRWRTA